MAGNDVAVARAERLFAATQASQGQNFTNFHASHQVYHLGFTWEQALGTFQNREKRDSRTRLKRIPSRFGPGTWRATFYLKDASAAGAEPEIGAYMRSGVGAKTVVPATVVHDTSGAANATNTASLLTVSNNALKAATITTPTYKGAPILVRRTSSAAWEYTTIVSGASSTVLANRARIRISPELAGGCASGTVVTGSVMFKGAGTSPPAIAQLLLRDHVVYRLTGGGVGALKLSAPGDGESTIEFSGEHMRTYWTGTDVLAATIAPGASSLTVQGSAGRFGQGSLILITSGSKKEVVYVRTSPATTPGVALTGITRGLKGTTATTLATGATMTPWYPGCLGTNATASQGRPIPGFKGVVQTDGADLVVRGAETNVETGVKMITGEKDGQYYVRSFSTPRFREVSGSLRSFFRKADARRHHDGFKLKDTQICIPVGNPEDGKLILWHHPQADLNSPAFPDTEEEQEVDVAYSAHGAANFDNDEFYIAWIQ